MVNARRLPHRDHHWEVKLPSRTRRHDEVFILPSGVLEARDQAFEAKEGDRVVMRTSNFYAPGYWLSVERKMGDQRGGVAY